jgi:hypothetical protein
VVNALSGSEIPKGGLDPRVDHDRGRQHALSAEVGQRLPCALVEIGDIGS